MKFVYYDSNYDKFTSPEEAGWYVAYKTRSGDKGCVRVDEEPKNIEEAQEMLKKVANWEWEDCRFYAEATKFGYHSVSSITLQLEDGDYKNFKKAADLQKVSLHYFLLDAIIEKAKEVILAQPEKREKLKKPNVIKTSLMDFSLRLEEDLREYYESMVSNQDPEDEIDYYQSHYVELRDQTFTLEIDGKEYGILNDGVLETTGNLLVYPEGTTELEDKIYTELFSLKIKDETLDEFWEQEVELVEVIEVEKKKWIPGEVVTYRTYEVK